MAGFAGTLDDQLVSITFSKNTYQLQQTRWFEKPQALQKHYEATASCHRLPASFPANNCLRTVDINRIRLLGEFDLSPIVLYALTPPELRGA